MTRTVAVACTSPLSRDAGLAAVADGGNAVDAAIAAAVVTMSTEPGIVSLMGGAFINVWPADGPPEVIDGNVEMPGRGLPRVRFGQGVRQVVTGYGGGVTMWAGHGSVANSGAVPALDLASQRHGDLPWERLVTPAADACRAGYPMGSAASYFLGFVRESLFGHDDAAHALVMGSDGSTLRPGEMSSNVDLADVLDLLAAQGPTLFSTGEVGRALVEMMESNGGLITDEDLAAYAPIVREPVLRALGDWTLAINPPPSVGGPMLAIMLGELDRRGTWDAMDVIDIQRRVLSYRRNVHDRSWDLDTDGRNLLEAVERYGLAGLPTSASTAHVSTVDSDGTACSITMSSGYGSGLAIPDTGILLNNALGEPELNRLGLHAVTPGTRLASNMAPTTGRTADGRSLSIGSPGADRITTALMQVIGAACLKGTLIQDAISAPRSHVRLLDDDAYRVDYEAAEDIAAAVAEAGLDHEVFDGLDMYFGGVGAAVRRADGSLTAAGDSRREAAVGVS
ncbi:MAG: gamma-glutamyltransferase [Dermatophilaceae bacterium]